MKSVVTLRLGVQKGRWLVDVALDGAYVSPIKAPMASGEWPLSIATAYYVETRLYYLSPQHSVTVLPRPTDFCWRPVVLTCGPGSAKIDVNLGTGVHLPIGRPGSQVSGGLLSLHSMMGSFLVLTPFSGKPVSSVWHRPRSSPRPYGPRIPPNSKQRMKPQYCQLL